MKYVALVALVVVPWIASCLYGTIQQRLVRVHRSCSETPEEPLGIPTLSP